ncbi:MAG: 50S ribosomal protein L24 [Desulfobacterales bacterium]|jgi:large subunit ribosomal protein L24|nr:50S ribosomal protein L24 [Desulfobacteraceae bacterium]MBT4364080.1 50S ribosomal protein L24 [Desulfobacteraceae bacterium]MBT7086360.1 50S ribosomal protein L24 [Desulfobacterales bacterium]MBT7696275.1 50S ribosomal protein L24 [Desulfobacterales bacterium]
MLNKKISIRKDDKVKIIVGKDKGKIGKVLSVNKKNNRVVVENINFVKRHTKPNPQSSQGGIVEKEAPIHWSNVMIMCDKCITPTRIKMKLLEDNKKVRVCSKCNEVLDS